MVALENHTYAVIQDGKVHWIFTINELPEWNESDIATVDITEESPMPEIGWSFDGTTFSSPQVEVQVFDLSKAQAIKASAISKACEQFILAGFSSSALGAVHTYPNDDRDQVNLSGSILRSTLPSAQATDTYPFLCADENDVWEYRHHTAKQIQQVGEDSYGFILAARAKNATLQTQIQAATAQEELDAIVW